MPDTVWGRLEETSQPVAVSTVWGAASRAGDRATVWVSDPPEVARRAAVGDPEPPRRGLGRFFGAPVKVVQRELRDSDVVLAVLLALHPRGGGWPITSLPASLQLKLAHTVMDHRRGDGQDWRPRTQHDMDAVAELLCAMARFFHRDPSPENEQRLLDLVEHLPGTVEEAQEVMARLG